MTDEELGEIEKRLELHCAHRGLMDPAWQDTITKLVAEVRRLRTELEDLREDYDELEDEFDDLRDEADELRSELGDADQ